jgi:hypothetical protein
MNCKDFTRKHALALATISFVPLATLGNLSLPAEGADYQQPFPDLAPTYDKVDFASGWYVRGDIAYAQESFPAITPALALTRPCSTLTARGPGWGTRSMIGCGQTSFSTTVHRSNQLELGLRGAARSCYPTW